MSLGGLLRDFYRERAGELNALKARRRADGGDFELEERIGELEQLFSDQPPLWEMDADEALENWYVPRKTGDAKVDRWEEQIARGETPNLDE